MSKPQYVLVRGKTCAGPIIHVSYDDVSVGVTLLKPTRFQREHLQRMTDAANVAPVLKKRVRKFERFLESVHSTISVELREMAGMGQDDPDNSQYAFLLALRQRLNRTLPSKTSNKNSQT